MQNGTHTFLPSANEGWGFFGTIRRHADPKQAWALAMQASEKTTALPEHLASLVLRLPA